MVEPCFGLIWMELRPECWIYDDLCNGLERNRNGLERTIYVPILTVLPVILKKRSNGLERKSRSSPFCHVSAISEQKWLFCAGEWPNWLPTVGHTLAKTHVYKSKYTSLRIYWLTGSVLCVSTVLCLILDSPEPWLGPVVCTKILSSCSYPSGQWCNCEHGWILGFSFSPSLWPVLFLLPWEEQVQHCHHVSYTNKQYPVVIAGMW